MIDNESFEKVAALTAPAWVPLVLVVICRIVMSAAGVTGSETVNGAIAFFALTIGLPIGGMILFDYIERMK